MTDARQMAPINGMHVMVHAQVKSAVSIIAQRRSIAGCIVSAWRIGEPRF
jgi:hypothetical protein